MRSVAVAFGFLTRLPVPRVVWEAGDLARSRAWFPLVGVVVAASGTLARWAVALALPDIVAVVAGVLAMVVVTGGLHEDGLADAVDGLWGGTDRGRRLEIMQDSRIGTYGAVALAGSLALQVTLLAPLGVFEFLAVAMAGHALGRYSTLPVSAILPAVEGSRAMLLADRTSTLGWAVASLTVVIVLLGGLGADAWAPVVLALLAAAACVAVIRAKVGGVTGDLLGATNQVVHVSSMAAAVAVIR